MTHPCGAMAAYGGVCAWAAGGSGAPSGSGRRHASRGGGGHGGQHTGLVANGGAHCPVTGSLGARWRPAVLHVSCPRAMQHSDVQAPTSCRRGRGHTAPPDPTPRLPLGTPGYPCVPGPPQPLLRYTQGTLLQPLLAGACPVPSSAPDSSTHTPHPARARPQKQLVLAALPHPSAISQQRRCGRPVGRPPLLHIASPHT